MAQKINMNYQNHFMVGPKGNLDHLPIWSSFKEDSQKDSKFMIIEPSKPLAQDKLTVSGARRFLPLKLEQMLSPQSVWLPQMYDQCDISTKVSDDCKCMTMLMPILIVDGLPHVLLEKRISKAANILFTKEIIVSRWGGMSVCFVRNEKRPWPSSMANIGLFPLHKTI